MTANARIAKNTLALYFRQILIMLVSLYTSRITLSTLGIVDYGIYNAIGGFVSMFSIISGALSVAISRFITIEIGNGNSERLRTIFSTSVLIQVFMAAFVIILAEVFGVYFLNAKMVIPEERIEIANIVFQCSLAAFSVNLISVPYNAAIIAHERMLAFAYISVLEVVLKLIIVFFLTLLPFDKLGVYALLLVAVSFVIRFVYALYCRKNFEETKFKFCFEKKLVKEMLSFIGWAFFGNGVVVLKDQGINVLINIFCGPAVNAARGVAMQVNSAVYSFVQNFLTAVNPQITKNYACKDFDAMHTLIIRSAKFGFLIMLLLVVPLSANIKYVLGLWLVEVPSHTEAFVVLVLLCSLVGCLKQPLVTGVLAEGKIRNYEIALTVIYLSSFMLAYFLLKQGLSVELIFVLNIVFETAVLFALLVQSRQKYSFPVRRFFARCLIPAAAAFSLCIVLVFALPVGKADSFFVFLRDLIVIEIICCFSAFFIGMNKKERLSIQKKISGRIKGVIRK